MPTIFEKNGFRFFFYSADWDEPIHVHIEHGVGKAKFWMNPIILDSSYKLNSKELKKARIMIEQNSKLIREKWNEYFKYTKNR